MSSPYIPGNERNKLGSRADRVPDMVAVERYVAGDHSIMLTAVERATAIDILDQEGYSICGAARLLGFSSRTIMRRRRARRLASEVTK